jgi:hypothetical protein
MKHFLLFSISSLMIFSSCSYYTPNAERKIATYNQVDFEKIDDLSSKDIEIIKKSVVYLETNSGYKCTGTVVSKTFILTAAHCVRTMRTMFALPDRMIKIYDYKHNLIATSTDSYVHKKYLDAKSKDYDIAYVGINSDAFNNFVPARATSENFALNEDVLTLGFGKNIEKMLNPENVDDNNFNWGERLMGIKGKIGPAAIENSFFSFFKKPIPLTLHSMKFSDGDTLVPGDSGGPVFKLDNMEIVGVNSGCADIPKESCFFQKYIEYNDSDFARFDKDSYDNSAPK